MVKLVFALVIAGFLAGCAKDNTEAAKTAVKRHLPIAYGIEYAEMENFPGGVVCGEFTPIGRFGVPEKSSPFIYRDEVADVVPSEDDLAIFCTKDPESALRARFGIGTPSKNDTNLLKVFQDLRDLDQALEAYRSDNGIYPLTSQGLEALAIASKKYPAPAKFREGGYIAQIPKDPWGAPYVYASEEVLRMEPVEYSLYTLGKDGVEGGGGEDADISVMHLKYLDHITAL